MFAPLNISQFQTVSWYSSLHGNEFTLSIWDEAMEQRVHRRALLEKSD
jgi:hypothetical protein